MMLLFLIVIGLAATFTLTLASMAWEDVLVGIVLGAALVALYRRQVLPPALPSAPTVLRTILHLPQLAWLLTVDIFRGTWQVVAIVLGVRPLAHPGIIKIPLGSHSRVGSAAAAFLITLSPGSFLLGFDWDEEVMLVHYIDISDPDALRAHAERYYAIWETGAARRERLDEAASGGEGT
jgi:multisubunit Na+/H+ antiporter MnhE subunit